MEDCVSLRRIVLYVSRDASIPPETMEWTPEDTELILTIGATVLKQAKYSVVASNSKEIAKEIEKELSKKYEEDVSISRAMLEKAEKEVSYHKDRIRIIEDEQESQLQRRLKQSKDIFESMLDTYKKEREEMRRRINELEYENIKARDYRTEMEQKVNKEALSVIRRELDNMNKMLIEKDKQIEAHKELFEKSISRVDSLTQKRDVASIGKIGEGQFRELASTTFRDFEGFQLKEVCSIGGLGDFHLQFKEMTILVDSKLYTNKVNSTSREKIKRDLLNNEHIHFAWLVSMDTYVDRFDKAPFMFEWINTQKCVCYINCLKKQDEPGELLRSVWYCCKALKQMIETEDAEKGEITVLKEREMKMRETISKMVKLNKERDTLMSQMRQNFDRSDEYIRDMLNDETAVVVNEYYRLVVEWWNQNMEETKEEGLSAIKSTAIWTQFKRDLGERMMGIEANAFKDILFSMLGETKVIKPKVKGGALELKGIKWKAGVQKDVK